MLYILGYGVLNAGFLFVAFRAAFRADGGPGIPTYQTFPGPRMQDSQLWFCSGLPI